jgi:hypothetical protein
MDFIVTLKLLKTFTQLQKSWNAQRNIVMYLAKSELRPTLCRFTQEKGIGMHP